MDSNLLVDYNCLFKIIRDLNNEWLDKFTSCQTNLNRSEYVAEKLILLFDIFYKTEVLL